MPRTISIGYEERRALLAALAPESRFIAPQSHDLVIIANGVHVLRFHVVESPAEPPPEDVRWHLVQRYHDDAVFHFVVDTMYSGISAIGLSADDIESVCNLIVILIEERARKWPDLSGIPEWADASTMRPDYLGIARTPTPTPTKPDDTPSKAERRATLLQHADAYEAIAVKMRRAADALDDDYLAYRRGELPDPRD